MTPHSFGYMTVIAVETLIVGVLVLCVWYLARQLRSLRETTSEKLSSTTAKALAHFMEECELPPPPEHPVELPDLPDIPAQTALPDPPPVKAETEARPASPPSVETGTAAGSTPSPEAAGGEAAVRPAASRKRRQCAHRRRASVPVNNDAAASPDLRVRKSVRSVDEPADDETPREAQIA